MADLFIGCIKLNQKTGNQPKIFQRKKPINKFHMSGTNNREAQLQLSRDKDDIL